MLDFPLLWPLSFRHPVLGQKLHHKGFLCLSSPLLTPHYILSPSIWRAMIWFPWNSSQSHCLMILVANLGCQKHQAQSGPSSCPLFVSLLVTCLLVKWEMPYFQLLSVLILGEVPSHHSLPDSSEYLKQMKSLNSFRYFLNALLSWKRVSWGIRNQCPLAQPQRDSPLDGAWDQGQPNGGWGGLLKRYPLMLTLQGLPLPLWRFCVCKIKVSAYCLKPTWVLSHSVGLLRPHGL